MINKKDNFEETLAFKSFKYCPIPGVDILVGATVLAVTESAKYGFESAVDSVKQSISDGIDDFRSDGEKKINNLKKEVVTNIKNIVENIVEKK